MNSFKIKGASSLVFAYLELHFNLLVFCEDHNNAAAAAFEGQRELIEELDRLVRPPKYQVVPLFDDLRLALLQVVHFIFDYEGTGTGRRWRWIEGV